MSGRVHVRVGAAILAAGGSRRLGRPKQLVAWRGEPLVATVARQVCASRCDRVAVVLGASAAGCLAALAGLAVAPVCNALWPEGIASSIRCAVAWAVRTRCDALVLVACDQPHLTAAHVDALVAAHRASGRTIGSAYAGTAGIPAIFAAGDLPRLAMLRGDTGARALLVGQPTLAWPDGAFDVDTPRDAHRGMGRAPGEHHEAPQHVPGVGARG